MQAAPTDPLKDLPHSGDVIADKYQLEERLGRGGMGVVYAARHLTLRTRVAVKFLAPVYMEKPEAAARFLREARAAASIQSEHVARVLDVGQLESGALYMVMELLTGDHLGKVVRARGKLPITEAVDLVLQASEAIAEAHALGIVHRDLKPANLFVANKPDGTKVLKVLDFGLSKVTDFQGASEEELSLTGLGLLMGSPFFMSPEQMRNAREVDGRTDVWALGVVLYLLVTGRKPFQGDSITAICASIAADDPPPMRQFHPVPQAFEAIVRKCLTKDPAGRYESVAAFVTALKGYATARGRVNANRTLKLSSASLREAMAGRGQALGVEEGPEGAETRAGGRAPPATPAAEASPEEDSLDQTSVPGARSWPEARASRPRSSSKPEISAQPMTEDWTEDVSSQRRIAEREAPDAAGPPPEVRRASAGETAPPRDGGDRDEAVEASAPTAVVPMRRVPIVWLGAIGVGAALLTVGGMRLFRGADPPTGAATPSAAADVREQAPPAARAPALGAVTAAAEHPPSAGAPTASAAAPTASAAAPPSATVTERARAEALISPPPPLVAERPITKPAAVADAPKPAPKGPRPKAVDPLDEWMGSKPKGGKP
jgi:serine/threonine-protein kinase